MVKFEKKLSHFPKAQKYLLNGIKFIPLYVCKNTFTNVNFKTYFQLLMPLIGFTHFLTERRCIRPLIPFYLMLAYGLIFSLLFAKWPSVVRIIQVTGLAGFCQFLVYYYKKEDLLTLAKSVSLMGLAYTVLELLAGNSMYQKEILPFPPFDNIRILMGVVGEPNFTAILMTGLSFIFFTEKKWIFAILCLVLTLVTGSRTAIICILIFLLIFVIRKIPSKQRTLILWCFLGLIVGYPLIVHASHHLLPETLLKKIYFISNGRSLIHASYMKYLLQNPLGIGFFEGRMNFRPFVVSNLAIPSYASDLLKYDYEQHSLIIQALTEFGYVGYAFLVLFLITITKKCLEFSSDLSWAFLCLLLGFTQLNGFAEFILYFYIAFIITNHRNLITQRQNNRK